ncbi:MAG TPA: ABC transporter substrate-binding protein [Acidimicrobiales bacterium]|nr:ABC transporter substrate-binding protein [Acidimicrobiales bacterium]
MHRSKVRVRWIAPLLVLALLTACTGAKLPKQTALDTNQPESALLEANEDGVTDTTTVVDAQGNPVVSGPGTTAARVGATTAKPGSPTATVPGGAPRPATRSNLFTAAEDTIGLTKNSITLCAHAALTYGAAFDTSEEDLNVYWTALNAKGGVHGRKVNVTYVNDNYNPDTAVTAATECKGRNPFYLLGGIGFDQIPAVRNWAEVNRMLYLHHTATVEGTRDQRFSFAPLPTTEKMGEMYGELVVARYRDKKIGVIRRASPNWDPGYKAFKAVLEKHNMKIQPGADKPVQVNQGNYTQDLLDIKNSGATVVFGWENALAAVQIVKQAKAQDYNPTWLLFPFNLTSQSLDSDALNPKMVGIAMFTAYSNKFYGGSFAAYANDMKEFEAQYARHRPDAELDSLGGDLLFLNWTAQKAQHLMLEACGADCTRNKLIDTMNSYKSRPFPAACETDFTRPGFPRMGGFAVNVMETFRAPDGKVNWRNTDTCVEHLI